jgi:excinuclease ABC subunit A
VAWTSKFPLGRFVCVTGVSGSGKNTLVREILHSTLEDRLKSQAANQKIPTAEESAEIERPTPSLRLTTVRFFRAGRQLGRVVMVDQSALGKTPRSNPAVYMGAFDAIRELFAQTDWLARRG